MTRRDYEKFARRISAEVRDASNAGTQALRATMRQTLYNTAQLCADVFVEDNPRFDKARFIKACGLE